MAKTAVRLTTACGVLAAATYFGTSASYAYGNAPWCAVMDLGSGDAFWDCEYRTVEECVPHVLAGNRGSCNLNPSPGPVRAAPVLHRPHHVRHARRR